MVNSTWARCEFCWENILESNLVYVPCCLYCQHDNEKFFFHRFCLHFLYDEYRRKIKIRYEERFNIECEICDCGRFTCKQVWS